MRFGNPKSVKRKSVDHSPFHHCTLRYIECLPGALNMVLSLRYYTIRIPGCGVRHNKFAVNALLPVGKVAAGIGHYREADDPGSFDMCTLHVLEDLDEFYIEER